MKSNYLVKEKRLIIKSKNILTIVRLLGFGSNF